MSQYSLLDLLHIYEDQLCDREFIFTLENNQVIRFAFYREQLCHLLGIQHVFRNDRRFTGSRGFESIKKQTLTLESMKAHNKAAYAKMKERLIHFPEIPNLVQNGRLLRFYQDRTYPQTMIRADLCIFQENRNYIIHLFLIQEQSTDFYAPTSFVVKSYNDDTARQFLDRQEMKRIKERKIIMKF